MADKNTQSQQQGLGLQQKFNFDVTAVHEDVSGLAEQVADRFNNVDARFNNVDERINKGFNNLDERFNNLESRINQGFRDLAGKLEQHRQPRSAGGRRVRLRDAAASELVQVPVEALPAAESEPAAA